MLSQSGRLSFSKKVKTQDRRMDTNKTAFHAAMQAANCGKYVVICNGEVLGHFSDMIVAIRYVREEIKSRKHAIDVFTRLIG